jgi:hypothetical protein
MAVFLSPVGGVAAQFFTNTGAVLTGGKIYTYAAGTTTPATTFTSSNGATPCTNPIVLDAAGRVPSGGEIWLTDGVLYKFVLKDSNDVLIATYDNISGINSNFVAFINQQQIITATAGQTVFNLSISYAPGTNSLSVFVDGVNQYGPGAQYAYTETDADTVTFVSGLHVGAQVKFTTSQLQGGGATDAQQVSYIPPFINSVATNVEAKLAQTLSVKDFGAVGDGATDDTTAFTNAITAAGVLQCALYVPGTADFYKVVNEFTVPSGVTIVGDGWGSKIKQTTANKNIFIAGSFSKFDNLHLIGLGSSGTTFAATNCGIYADQVGNFTVANCFVEQFEGSGVEVRRCHDFEIIDNFFFANIWSSYGSGVPGASTADILLYSAAANSNRILIQGNYCLSNNSQGIFVDALGGNADIIVSNNICVTLNPATCTLTGAWTEFAMTSNASALQRRHAIVISYTFQSQDGPRCVVEANVCRNTGWTGIYKEGASQGPVVIANNICSNNGYGLSNALSGGIFAYVDGNELIQGNYIYNFRNTDASGSGGITLVATTAPTNRAQVKNNTIKYSFNNGIFLGTNSAFVDVTNNTILSSSLCDIVWEAAPATAGVGNHVFAYNNILRTTGNLVAAIRIDAQASTYPTIIKQNIINGVNNTTSSSNNSGVRVSATNPQYVEIQENRIEKFYNGVYIDAVWTGRNFDVVLENNTLNNCAVGFVIKANSNNVTVPLVNNEYPLTTTQTDADGFFVAGRVCQRESKRLVWETTSAVPTVGSWIQGDRAYFTAPTASGFIGGVCVSTGTPGTWKTYGAISA